MSTPPADQPKGFILNRVKGMILDGAKGTILDSTKGNILDPRRGRVNRRRQITLRDRVNTQRDTL